MPLQQVFLSYSHRDDEPYGPQNRRWVEEFETALRSSIGQRIGPGRVEVWRDKRRLTGNELFDAQIEQQLDRSAIFVTVLSQHYLASAYCRKELQAFGQRHLARGDLQVDHLSRIVKVYRRAIDRADLRRFVDLPALIPEVDGTTGYELFYVDDGGVDRDVLLDPGKAGLYWQRADDIALAIKRMLDNADDAPGATAATAPAAPPVVYLARTASDMKDLREALQRELEDRGCRVLPDGEPPEEAQAYAAAVRADLQQALLSVHLVGARYGSIPEGADASGVVLQADLALAQPGPMRSILWSPPEVTAERMTEPRQREFIDRLEQAAFERDRAEFVRSSIEQLKSLLIDRLRPPPAAAAAPVPAADGVAVAAATTATAVYLVCDPIDRADTKPLKDALAALGFAVTRPSIEGTPDELLDENKANLLGNDVVVVVWGQTREAWVRGKLREAQQAPGWGRDRPYRGKFVVVVPPDTPAKLDFDVPPDVVVLRGAGASQQLDDLLRRH